MRDQLEGQDFQAVSHRRRQRHQVRNTRVEHRQSGTRNTQGRSDKEAPTVSTLNRCGWSETQCRRGRPGAHCSWDGEGGAPAGADRQLWQDQDQNAKRVKEEENERTKILWDFWTQTVGIAGDNRNARKTSINSPFPWLEWLKMLMPINTRAANACSTHWWGVGLQHSPLAEAT